MQTKRKQIFLGLLPLGCALSKEAGANIAKDWCVESFTSSDWWQVLDSWTSIRAPNLLTSANHLN